jgi:hypothetical protein
MAAIENVACGRLNRPHNSHHLTSNVQMSLRLIFAIGFALILPACVTAPSFVSLFEGPDAVQIRHRKFDESYTVWDRIAVVSVDDKFIGSTYVGATTQVAPGDRKLVVRMHFRRGVGAEYEGFATLAAPLPSTARLELNGRVDGTEVEVWLEDAKTKARLGQAGRGAWRVVPLAPTPMPIFISR